MKVNILGIKFDCLSLAAVCGKIEAMIEKGGCYQVGTMNPEYVVRVQDNKQLARAISRMSLVVPDGMGIIWAAKLKKLGRLKRIRGGDLVEVLAEICARKGYKIGLVGGERGVAQKALRVLQKKYPGLQGFADSGPMIIAAHDAFSCSGEFASDVASELSSQCAENGHLAALNEKIIKKIQKEKPQVLLTALSFKGPVWTDQLLSKLKKKKISLVAFEVGGVFNYLTGKSRVPPKIIKEIGLEWFWRLVTEPWRWKRQLSLVRFLFLYLKA